MLLANVLLSLFCWIPLSFINSAFDFLPLTVCNKVEPGYSDVEFMRLLVYNVRYSVVPTNSSLLTAALHSSARTTLAYNDTKH
jgi:hypothetical protein